MPEAQFALDSLRDRWVPVQYFGVCQRAPDRTRPHYQPANRCARAPGQVLGGPNERTLTGKFVVSVIGPPVAPPSAVILQAALSRTTMAGRRMACQDSKAFFSTLRSQQLGR